jgi:hypothetical protein
MDRRGIGISDQERLFHECRAPTVRRSTIYGGTVEEAPPRPPLRPLYPC